MPTEETVGLGFAHSLEKQGYFPDPACDIKIPKHPDTRLCCQTSSKKIKMNRPRQCPSRRTRVGAASIRVFLGILISSAMALQLFLMATFSRHSTMERNFFSPLKSGQQQTNQMQHLQATADASGNSPANSNIDGQPIPTNGGSFPYSPSSSSKVVVVVVYTGPTSMNANEGKNWMYLRNFQYFLDHGLDCLAQDTILVLTKEVAAHFRKDIAQRQLQCDSQRRQMEAPSKTSWTLTQPSIQIIEREDKCYDMEGFRVVLEQVDLSAYEYLVYLNCGLVGPKLRQGRNAGSSPLPWTQRYTTLLSSTVKMSGLSINCDISPHVQSMLFAVDKVGLDIIRKSGAVYECRKSNADMSRDDKWKLIRKYEIGMGRAILEAGYHLKSTHGMYGSMEIRPWDLDSDFGWCSHDIWHFDKLPVNPETRWEDFVFFKSSRMFLLPDMKEEIGYGDNHYLPTLRELPGPSTKRRERDIHQEYGYLWDGGARQEDFESLERQSLRLSIVISHCRGDLSWLLEYLDGYPYQSITVVSKCGITPRDKDLPPGTRLMALENVGRIDHTMAYWMANVIPKEAITENDILLFLKDNLFQHPPGRRRKLDKMMAIASANDFACLQIPLEGMSQYHLTEVLQFFNMTSYDGMPKYAPDGSRIYPNSNEAFKSKYRNIGEWMQSLGHQWHSKVVPVCYGGSYAVRIARVLEVPLDFRHKLERCLARADNIEEGHFAERLWASLLSPPLHSEQIDYLLTRAQEINSHVAIDGGGLLGALEEWDVFGHVRTPFETDTRRHLWIRGDDGKWQWPRKYQAKVIDSDNVCIRPVVEPAIPDISTTNTSDPRAAPFTAVMCSVVRKSDLRYINEWLDYHIVHGFAHFFLYDSHPTPHLEGYLNVTRPGWYNYVTVDHWRGAHSRKHDAWSQCATRAQMRRPISYTWVANLDVDEFLVLWKHDNVVRLLEQRCLSGSIQIASYNFAPDSLTKSQKKALSQHGDVLNEEETFFASASLSSFGLPGPILYRNFRCGALGFDGRKGSTSRLQTKTIAAVQDLEAFDKSFFPVLANGTFPKSSRGNILTSNRPSPRESGSDYASIFRFPFKSIPEYIYQHCRGDRTDNHTNDPECERHKELAFNSKFWAPYREDRDRKGWKTLMKKIPWYRYFDASSSGSTQALGFDTVDCRKYHPVTSLSGYPLP